MAGRKRHSAEDIVRKLRRADELTAAGKTGEEIAAELGVSAATLYNWRRAYGGMDTDAAKEQHAAITPPPESWPKSADRRPVGAPWFAKIRRWSPVVVASGAAGSLLVFVVVVPGKTLVR